jgi:DNA invertase Pin-like site-specific DNA recombinase
VTTFGTVTGMDLGYARVSTAKQDLDRQVEALTAAGIDPQKIYLDKKSGATTDRPGLRALLEYARDGDVIVVHTLDRLGRTVRDTLNLIHELTDRGGVRNLADPIRVDSSNPDDPMGQLAVVLLALFAQMERTYTVARRARPRRRGREGPPCRAALGGRPGQGRLRRPPARHRPHHRRDRGQDRHHPLQPVPAPAAATGRAGDRGHRDDRGTGMTDERRVTTIRAGRPGRSRVSWGRASTTPEDAVYVVDMSPGPVVGSAPRPVRRLGNGRILSRPHLRGC